MNTDYAESLCDSCFVGEHTCGSEYCGCRECHQ